MSGWEELCLLWKGGKISYSIEANQIDVAYVDFAAGPCALLLKQRGDVSFSKAAWEIW